MATANDIEKILIDLFEKLGSEKELTRRGLEAVRIIRTRTRAWRDVNGRRFEDYSSSYKKRRLLFHLAITPGGKNTDSMLFFTPHTGMMYAFDAHFIKNGVVEIKFDDARKEQLAYYHNISGVAKRGMHLRKFWGLAEREQEFLANRHEERMEILLGELTEERGGQSA